MGMAIVAFPGGGTTTILGTLPDGEMPSFLVVSVPARFTG
jgi:hypothetical protein